MRSALITIIGTYTPQQYATQTGTVISIDVPWIMASIFVLMGLYFIYKAIYAILR